MLFVELQTRMCKNDCQYCFASQFVCHADTRFPFYCLLTKQSDKPFHKSCHQGLCTSPFFPHLLVRHGVACLFGLLLPVILSKPYAQASMERTTQGSSTDYVRLWLLQHIETHGQYTLNDQRQALKTAIGTWDPGALRTVHAYYGQLGDFELCRFLHSYYLLDYHDFGSWRLYNPSAAAVALCRKMQYLRNFR